MQSSSRLNPPKIVKKASRDPARWQEGQTQWYMQTAAQTAGPWYFFPLSKQKNGGLAGLMVDVSFDQRAKKKSLTRMDYRLWGEVPESEVPAKVKSMVENAKPSKEASRIVHLQKRLAHLRQAISGEVSQETQLVRIRAAVLLLENAIYMLPSETPESRSLSDLVIKARNLSRSMVDSAQNNEARRLLMVLERYL